MLPYYRCIKTFFAYDRFASVTQTIFDFTLRYSFDNLILLLRTIGLSVLSVSRVSQLTIGGVMKIFIHHKW